MKTIEDELITINPKDRHTRICPYDQEICDAVRITPLEGGMPRTICRYSHMKDAQSLPCLKNRKGKKSKQKIKRKPTRSMKKKNCGCK